MRHCGCVTLFCPEETTPAGTTWRRYLLYGVTLETCRGVDGESGVLYIFDRFARAYSGGVQCEMPEIGVGCAVAADAFISDESAEVTELPDAGLMKILAVKRYCRGGVISHTKLTLG